MTTVLHYGNIIDLENSLFKFQKKKNTGHVVCICTLNAFTPEMPQTACA